MQKSGNLNTIELMSRPLPPSFFSTSTPLVIVCGGAGFLGAKICEEFLGRGLKVLCVDNWQSGSRENLSAIAGHPNFYLLEGDTADESIYKGVERADYIIDATAVEREHQNEGVVLQMSAEAGLKNLLDLSIRLHAKFLLVSSVYVTTPANTLFLDAKRFSERMVRSHVEKQRLNGRIVRIGDVYGAGMYLGGQGTIALVLKSVLRGEAVRVNAREILYPIFITDVVWGIVKSLFSAGTRGFIISLCGPRTTSLSVLEAVGTLRPTSKIECVNGGEQEDVPSGKATTGRELISWEPHTTLIEGIAYVLDWYKSQKKVNPALFEEVPPITEGEDFWKEEEKVEVVKKIPEKKEKKVERGGAGWIFWGLIAGFILIFWLGVFPFVELLFGIANLKVADAKFKKGEYAQVSGWTRLSQFWFDSAAGGFERFLVVPIVRPYAQKYVNSSQIYSRAALVLGNFSNIDSLGQKFFEKVFSDESLLVERDSKNISTNLLNLETQLAFLSVQIENLGKNPLKRYFPIEDDLSTTRTDLHKLSEVFAQMPSILGQDKKKTYLILVQDNTELRGSGGVNVLYGMLTFEKGRLTSSSFEPVDTADARLSGHVEPPAPLRKYLETGWFLKDSGWSPDFAVSSARAEWFIDKELEGQKVDGVISFDLDYLKEALGKVGPLNIDGALVKQDNFYKKYLDSTKAGNKNFTKEVVSALFEKLTKDPGKTSSLLGEATVDALNKKHILLFSNDEHVAQVLNEGWGGRVRSATCFKEGQCFKDYLYFLDSNLGQDKVNYYTEQSFTLDIALDKQTVTHRLTVNYNNRSQGKEASTYKNYFKALVLPDAKNYKAVLVDESKSKEEDVEIENAAEVSRQAVGGYIEIPAGETRKLVVSWDEPMQENFNEYSLLWQKQPGTESDPFWLTVNYPGHTPKSPTPVPSLTGLGSVGYNNKLSGDFSMDTKW